MRKTVLVSSLGLIAAAALSVLATPAHAAIDYAGALTGNSVQYLERGNSFGTAGIGDDYSTSSATISLKGLQFFGGLTAGTTTDSLFIDFYTTAGVRVATLFPSPAEVSGTGVHTLDSSDFVQNGITGVTIPGSGYIIFSPYSNNGANANPNFVIGAGGAAPTVGTNDVNNAAQTTPSATTGLATLSTSRLFYGFGTTNQYAAFVLSDTPLPEPASLGLLLPAAMMLGRRRSAAV